MVDERRSHFIVCQALLELLTSWRWTKMGQRADCSCTARLKRPESILKIIKVLGFKSWTVADDMLSAGSGPTDAATVVQNFLNSLKGGQGIPTQQMQQGGQLFTTLPDLLPSSTTIPIIDSASPAQLDNLLSYLPPAILLIPQSSSASKERMTEPSAASASAAIATLPSDEKKAILKRVLRSPQFHQSLGSLTMAIRDGGLPSIADALGVKVHNGGLVKGGSVPLGGGEAVEAFVEGVKKSVEEKK